VGQDVAKHRRPQDYVARRRAPLYSRLVSERVDSVASFLDRLCRSARSWLGAVLLATACARPARWTEPVSGIEFALIPAGEFQMGSPESEPGHEPGEVLHTVRLTRPFYLATTEITQAQWSRVMGSNPSNFRSCGPDCPVEGVSWFDIQRFLVRLTRLSGRSFRLPTESEWEYACRAGATTAYSAGPRLDPDEANYDARDPRGGGPAGRFRGSPVAVRSFRANAFGLYDMHGNVWEWTEDEYCPYPRGAAVDPLARCDSPLRVIRGGSWAFDADSARCALRYTHRPRDSGYSLGFRLARAL